MMTPEDNIRITRVGPGTPGGEMLRRYWQPISAAGELSEEEPIKRVRVLGENLVLYRDLSGGYGLVAERCPHRHASLAYGTVDADGIRCPYHGWKFDACGKCLEQPAEPEGSKLKDEIQHTAYPVERLGGLLFAYLGPAPAPSIPRWDVLAWEHGKRWVQIHTLLNCSWLQAMENSVDPSHLYWLHGKSAHLAKMMPQYEEEHEFIQFDYGIMKRRTTPASEPGGKPQVDQHPLVFPNTLRHVLKDKKGGKIRHNLQFRMPVDDTHTQIYMVYFEPAEGEHSPADGIAPIEYFNLKGEDGSYIMDIVLCQDAMAWETQGPVLDRSQEILGVSDMGIVKYRRLLMDQIKIVEDGGTPLGVVPDKDRDRVIEFDVINERIGLATPERQEAETVS